MDLVKLREELGDRRVGVGEVLLNLHIEYKIYNDHLGYPTFNHYTKVIKIE